MQKHLALTNHQYNPQSLIFSKKVWDTLSRRREEDPEDTSAEAAPPSSAKSIARLADSHLADLKKAGMQESSKPRRRAGQAA